MKNKRRLLLITTLFALVSLAVSSTVSANPPAPPCLTTNLCFDNAIKVTDFAGASDLVVGNVDQGISHDIVTTGWTTDKIRIKTGLGDGTFWGTWTKNMGNGTYEVDIADFNGDGLPDIIATNKEQGRVKIRWGHNGWTGSSVWATDGGPFLVATGDFNNDGLDDFASGNNDPILDDSITVRLRLPGGGFSSLYNHNAYRLGDVAFNDCDNDGDLDMFFSTVDRNHPEEDEAVVRVLLNRGDGVFSSAKTIDMNSQGDGLALGKIAFGNINEDVWNDMIVTRNDQKLVLVLGTFDCNFQDPIFADVEGDPSSLEIMDMNWDGHLDIIVGYQYQELIEIYLGQGNGTLIGPYEPELTLDWRVNDIGVGDFNIDGRKDIVYADESGVWLLLARDPDSPAWESPFLALNNMEFAPAGESQLELILETVFVSSISTSGGDGVDVLLDSAKLWSADIDIEGRTGAQLQLDAIANETNTSSLQVISTSPSMEIRPTFNSASYLIEYQLKDKSQLLLTWPNDGQTPAASVNWDEIWCIMDLPPLVPSEICRLAFEYSVEPQDLYQWQVNFPVPLMMMAVNGNQVTADRIRMVEIPDSQGEAAKNGFSRIEIRGMAADSLTLSNVMMISAEPTAH